MRIRQKGYKILYNPTIKILYYGSVVAKKSIHMKKSAEYYISFLDGVYFNLFTNKKYLSKGKILNQLKNII